MDCNVQEEEGWLQVYDQKRSCLPPGPVANRVPVTKYTEGFCFVDCGEGGYRGGGMGGGGDQAKFNIQLALRFFR
jgi:hypothetical protein